MTAKRKTAGEVDLADKGQTSQRKLEINGSAGYAPRASLAHTHIHTPNKHTMLRFDAKIDLFWSPSEKLEKDVQTNTRTDGQK